MGSRSIRFHYNKSSKLNSHGTRPFPNDQEKGYGGDGGVDGSSSDGVRANGDADAEARQNSPKTPKAPKALKAQAQVKVKAQVKAKDEEAENTRTENDEQKA